MVITVAYLFPLGGVPYLKMIDHAYETDVLGQIGVFAQGRRNGEAALAVHFAIDGVADALSMTIPLGTGVHRRMVYVELEPGADFAAVEAAIKSDDYFCHDDTRVFSVPSVRDLKDMGHGVHLERKGVSGSTQNQRFEFRMSINNPALTAQIMASCARAACRLGRIASGAYTMPEIAPMDLLPGDRETLIRTLV